MRTIQINYDLRKPGRDYQPVYDYIKSFEGWCHLLDSCWLVRSWKTAGAIRDELALRVDRNDKIATSTSRTSTGRPTQRGHDAVDAEPQRAA